MTALERLENLSSARPATAADTIARVPARLVVAPESTEAAAQALRLAAAHDLAVVVRGGGTKQDWAAPPRRLDLIVDTSRLGGIVEHVAGDLVVVVRAGTPVAGLQAALAETGQQLALDTPLPGATVGGTVAVNTSGPRRLAYGTVRDLLIGVTVVRPDGVVARAGGKVVKNVAGYDLGKLFTGSYGTLGLITECVFRLHPRPVASTVLRRQVEPGGAGPLIAAMLAGQLAPTAIEVDLTPDRRAEVAVRLDGVPDGLRLRVASARAVLGGQCTEGEPAWWGAYPWPPGGIGIKLTAALSKVPDLITAAADARIALRGAAGTGVLYAGLPGGVDPAIAAELVERMRRAAAAAGGHAVVLTAPAPVRDRLDLWGPVPGLDLMRRVKQRFDPDGRFAPGRFVGGI